MSSLVNLFIQYGYQIAIVGLLGTVVIEILKVPMNKLLAKKFQTILQDAQKFDKVAFLLSLIVATILASIYTLLASRLAIFRASESSYLANIIGTWMFQLTYYAVYKKLGLKKLLAIIGKAIKDSIIKLLDKNKDNKVDAQEAIETIQNLIINKKLTKEEIEGLVTLVVTNTINGVSEASGSINQKEQLKKIIDEANNLVTQIPENSVKEVAKLAIDLVENKAIQIVEQDEPQTTAKRPVIKF